jgi:hypothetical protein
MKTLYVADYQLLYLNMVFKPHFLSVLRQKTSMENFKQYKFQAQIY